MLCRRAVVQTRRLYRHLSSESQFRDEILAEVDKDLSSSVAHQLANNQSTNPFEQSSKRDGPPLPLGLHSYASAKENPMSAQNVSQFNTVVTYYQPHYRFDCHSTRNNTITVLSSLTFNKERPYMPPVSKVVAWFSGGSVGFKKGRRGEYEAGYQCVVRVFKLLEELNSKRHASDSLKVDLYFKGFGQGREALKTALTSTEGTQVREYIKRIVDRTALKIGGTRAKKTRRI